MDIKKTPQVSLETTAALTIAGSDPSAGAGLQADLKTFSALGVYGCSVVSAITAQNTLGVRKVWPVPDDSVAIQLQTLLDDVSISAIKFGMLHRAQVINEISAILDDHTDIPIVCDPVIVSSSGSSLLDDDGIEALKKFIRKKNSHRTLILTPNLGEAAKLLCCEMAKNESQMIEQAEKLLEFGCTAVVLTGGHLNENALLEDNTKNNQSSDVFVCRQNNIQTCEVFRAARINTKNTHGTGCTFSAAIASGLAKKMTLIDSVVMAKEYVTYAIAHSDELKIGHGIGPLQHFYQ